MLVRSRREPNRFARELFDGLPDRYDLLAEVLSFGQNRRWRRAMVDAVAEGRPESVLDVATGTAGVALMLARTTGADITVCSTSCNPAARSSATRSPSRDPARRDSFSASGSSSATASQNRLSGPRPPP